MILCTNDLKDICSKILTAVDSDESSLVSETIGLKTENTYLVVRVTNREYVAEVKIDVDEEFDFHATVNAQTFLKLISQITTENVELNIVDNVLTVKANGTYKLPLIFEDDHLLEIPDITVENVTADFEISGDTLNSVLFFNSKELSKMGAMKPVQKMYYIDELGAITFTSGACVNMFSLPFPVKILLPAKIVKLFKLFKDKEVNFKLGHSEISSEIVQTRVSFETETVKISAQLACDNAMISSVPVEAIRKRAFEDYPFVATLNKDEITQAINRLLIFKSSANTGRVLCNLKFETDSITISDYTNTNVEKLYFTSKIDGLDSYTATVDMTDFKLTLDSCVDHYFNISFGNGPAMVLSRGNVYNVIPIARG